MPKLTSKVTIKLEPGLLDKLVELAESEGLPVSSYIRKAVIEHVGMRQDEGISTQMRIQPTRTELRVINRLMRLGYLRDPEDLFHKAFDLYLRQEYETIKRTAEREFLDDHVLGKEDPIRLENAGSQTFRDEGQYTFEEDEQEEGK